MTDAQPPVPLAPPVHTEIPEVPGRRRPRWILPVAIGGAALVVLAGGAATAFAVLSSQRTPEAVTSAFLGDLVAGDALGAQALLTDIPGTVSTLVQPDTYAATEGRIEGFRIVESRNDGRTATVRVEVEQDGTTYEQDVVLDNVGTELGLFTTWRVNSDVLPTVYITYARPDGMGLTVNGTELEFSGGTVQGVPALPGVYLFEPTGGTDFFGAEPVEVTLPLAPGEERTVALDVTLTEAGTASAQGAVNAHLDGCLAQPLLAPQGNCGFHLTQDGATYTNIRWTLVTRPTVTFGDYRSGEGWAVVPATPGSMRLDADFETATQYGTATGSIDNYNQAGFIVSIDEAGAAVFESVEFR